MDGGAGAGQDFRQLMLGELFGALDEAPESDRGRILKSFLLNSIDTMREHSLFQLDLVEKLAFIALDNVQDVRLLSLEARVKELEAGKPVTFGQIMGELFFALTVEAAILGVGAYAVPVAAGSAVLLASLEATVRNTPAMVRALPPVRRFEAGKVVAARRQALIGQADRLVRNQQQPWPPNMNIAESMRWFDARRPDAARLEADLGAVRRQITDLHTNREFEIAQVVEGMPLPEMMAPRYTALDAANHDGQVKKFIEDHPHLIDSTKSEARAFALLATKKYPEAFRGTGAPVEAVADAFTTTGATLEMVRECESLKLQVGLHYARVRAIMDAVPEDGVFDAFETPLILEDVAANLFDLVHLSDAMLANLQGHVVPMEIAVWLLYLRASGALVRDEQPKRAVASGPTSKAASRRFVGTAVATKLVSTTPAITDSPRATYDVRDYPGLGILDEHQAYYLYHRFAKQAFARFADKVPKSTEKDLGDFIHKDVAAGAFDRVLDMQKVFFLTGENEERATLIKEMGVVVIEFFRFVEERVGARKSFGFSQAIPAGTDIRLVLDRIEAPTLSGLPAEEPPPFTAEEWLAEEEAAAQLQWEEMTLARLGDLRKAYVAALARFEYHTAMRALYLEVTAEGFFDDVILGPAQADLASARLAIEEEFEAIQGGRYQSDLVDESVDALRRMASSAPVERPDRTLFDH